MGRRVKLGPYGVFGFSVQGTGCGVKGVGSGAEFRVESMGCREAVLGLVLLMNSKEKGRYFLNS